MKTWVRSWPAEILKSIFTIFNKKVNFDLKLSRNKKVSKFYTLFFYWNFSAFSLQISLMSFKYIFKKLSVIDEFFNLGYLVTNTKK